MPQTPGTADGAAAMVGGSPPTITALTGVRAVAAGWVLILHFGFVLPGYFPATSGFSLWSNTGILGVDIFFVLSGFVLSYNYAARLSRLDRRRYGAFLFARFARVYPVHLVTLLVSAALLVLFAIRGALPTSHETYTAGQLGANLLLFHALPGAVAWNAPAWSVGCEAVAYLLFPLGAALLLRLSRRAALAFGAVVVGIQVALTIDLGWARSSLPPLSLIRIAGEFTLGCLLWATWRHGVRPHWRWDLVALAMVGTTIIWLGVTPLGPLTFVAVPLLAVLVFAAASSAGPVRAVFASRPMEWGGRVSYSLYLTHWIVILALMKVMDPKALAGTSIVLRLAVLALYLLAIFVVAALTYHVVEEPARTWLRKRAAGSASIGFGDRPSADGAPVEEITAREPARTPEGPDRPADVAASPGAAPDGAEAVSIRPPSVR